MTAGSPSPRRRRQDSPSRSRERGDDSGKCIIWIGGCPPDVSERDLRKLCDPFGHITDVVIKQSTRDTYSFVHFERKEDGYTAIHELDQTRPFGDRVVKVAVATRKPEGGNSKGKGKGYDNKGSDKGRSPRRDSRSRYDRNRSSRSPPRHSRSPPPRRSRSPPPRRSPSIRRRSPPRRSPTPYKRDGYPPRRSPDRGGRDRSPRSRGAPPRRVPSPQRNDQAAPVKVYISQLPKDMEKNEFIAISGDFGKVLSHELWKESAYKCGWLEYGTKKEALACVQALDNRQMEDWNMRLNAYMYPTA